jgi:hypothetical protein
MAFDGEVWIGRAVATRGGTVVTKEDLWTSDREC